MTWSNVTLTLISRIKGELQVARISMGVAIVVATFWANPPGFAAQVVALAFGIAAASLFPVLDDGYFL